MKPGELEMQAIITHNGSTKIHVKKFSQKVFRVMDVAFRIFGAIKNFLPKSKYENGFED